MKKSANWIFFLITLFCLTQTVSAGTGSDGIPVYEKGMHFNTDTGADVLINTTLPGSPLSMTAYKGEYEQFGQIEIISPEWLTTQSNLPLENEASRLAQTALESYGGLPSDAYLDGIRTNIAYGVNVSTGVKEVTYPQSVELFYSRSVDNIPVIGEWRGDSIDIELGDDGKVLYLIKNWRTWTPDCEVPIINASYAIERLKHSKVNLLGSKNLEISRIKLIYYGMYPDREEGILEPVWQFAISRPVTSAEPTPFKEYFYVSAIEGESQFEFADFTASPTSGRAPLTVQFQDISKNNRVELWSWIFGDGNSSSEQNPIYVYDSPGIYTVILEALDEDRGSISVKKEYITVTGSTPPIANFTAIPTSGDAPLTVQFTDLSTEGPTSWAWDFGDGYISSEQNPVHQYDVSGTYTVNLTATNDGGSSTKTLTDYITVANPADPITLIDQLIVYVNNQNNVPKVFKRLLVGELKDARRALHQNRPGDAVLDMNVFKMTVNLLKGWPLTYGQAATMQNSADAIIDAIDIQVNQAAIDQTNSLSADVKSLHLQRSVERPLILKLDGAIFMLESAKDRTAVVYLNSFIASVRAQDGKKIPHDSAVQMIAKAEAIKAII